MKHEVKTIKASSGRQSRHGVNSPHRRVETLANRFRARSPELNRINSEGGVKRDEEGRDRPISTAASEPVNTCSEASNSEFRICRVSWGVGGGGVGGGHKEEGEGRQDN